MIVRIKYENGKEETYRDAVSIAIGGNTLDSPLLQRQSLIERVNQLLDAYEPKDARPI
jgi:hypothetical protein